MARLIKLIVLLCVVAAVFAKPVDEDSIETFENKDQSSIFGKRQEGDKLIHKKVIEVDDKRFKVHEQHLAYASTANITCVKVLDQLKTGNNAEFQITKGGVNHNAVSIRLKTTTGRMSYILEIYGL